MSLHEPERNISIRSLDIEETIRDKMMDTMRYGKHLATSEELDTPEWENGFPIMLNKLERSVGQYAERFDADEDLYGVIYLVFLGIKLSRNYGAQKNIDMVCEMLGTRMPPALVRAAGMVATDQSKYGRNSLPQLGVLQKVFIYSWTTGLKKAYAELDMDGIEGAPTEMFQELVEGYVTREFVVALEASEHKRGDSS